MAASLVISKMLFPVAVGNSNYNNLMTQDPKEAYSSGAAADMDFDFGASVTVDTLFVGFLSADAFTTINVTPSTGLGTGIGTANSLTIGPSTAIRRHAFLKVGSPITSRYFRVSFVGAGFTVGIVALGKAIQPTWGHEWGSGRGIDDRSFVDTLIGGGFGVQKNAIVPNWRFTVGDLTDAELDSLWDLAVDVGGAGPVLVVEDPSAASTPLNKGLHYGLFEKPEAYERLMPGCSKWSFQVQEWN
jgi:hypothetical protein